MRELAIKSQRAEQEEIVVSVTDSGVGLPHSRRSRSSTPSLLPSPTGPAWNFASAAPLSNRMVAACGLLTAPRAAQVFVSPYPPKARQRNETRRRYHAVRH